MRRSFARGRNPSRRRLQVWLVITLVAIGMFWLILSDEESQLNEVPQQPAVTPEPVYAHAFQRDTWPAGISEGAAARSSDALLESNYYLVLDASGSMSDSECSGRNNKMRAAVDAVVAFASSMPADVNLGLAVFNRGQIRELLPIGRVDERRLGAALHNLRPDGGTPLASALAFGLERLTEQGRLQLGYGEYHLVMVTDGIANTGEEPDQVVRGLLAETPVVLHTFGFCIGEDHALNQTGRILYRAADSPEALRAGLQAVLAEAPAFDIAAFQP